MNRTPVSRRSALAAMIAAAVAPVLPRWGAGGSLLAAAGAGPGTGRGPAGGEVAAGASRPAWVEREAYLMGTLLRGRVAAAREPGLRALEAAYDQVRRLETLLSTWRPDTELARLNRAPPGEPLAVSSELLGLLRRVRDLSRDTGGAFDPAVGPLVDAWGFRTGGRLPTPAELAHARSATGLRHFALDTPTGTASRRHPDAWIDSGAFGKGAGLEAAGAALRERGVETALLDFGGQLLALGGGPAGTGWPIHVAHPRRRSEAVARLAVRDRSVATSGASERYVELDGARLGHVLDPRTGRPVDAWGSVTVVTDDPVAADALATALFVLGPEEALRWARDRREIDILVLTAAPDGLRARWSGGMERWLEEAYMDEEHGDEIR